MKLQPLGIVTSSMHGDYLFKAVWMNISTFQQIFVFGKLWIFGSKWLPEHMKLAIMMSLCVQCEIITMSLIQLHNYDEVIVINSA